MSVIQVFGPASGGDVTSCYNFVFLIERRQFEGQAAQFARRALAAMQKRRFWLRVSIKVNVFALEIDHDFGSTNTTTGRGLNYPYQEVIDFAKSHGAPWAHCVGLGCWDLRGGTGSGGGGVFAASTAGNDDSVFVHEMGHAVAGLADEYQTGSGVWQGAEPVAPNMTANRDLATCKWRALVTHTTPWPTRLNNGLSQDRPKNPDGTFADLEKVLGLFEGGHGGYVRGVFRPTNASCIMYLQVGDYCPVCEEAMVRTILAKAGVVPVPPPPPALVNIGLHPDAGSTVIKAIDASYHGLAVVWQGRTFLRGSADQLAFVETHPLLLV